MFCVRTNNTPYKIGKFDIIDKTTAATRALDFTKKFQEKIAKEASVGEVEKNEKKDNFVYLRIKRKSQTEFEDWKMDFGVGSELKSIGILASVIFFSFYILK